MKVELYTTEVCPWCHKAKEFVEKNKIEYSEKNVQKYPELAAELLEKSGQMGVPVITIDDKLMIGFNKNRLKRTLKI